MSRYSCVQCRRRREQKFMIETVFYSITRDYIQKRKVFVCLSCVEEYQIRLSSIILLLKELIIKMSTLVD